MSKSINAYLMLGWDVEIEDAKHYDVYDGFDEHSLAGIKAALAELGIEAKDWYDCMKYSINFWSLYHDCEWMRLGFVLASNSDTKSTSMGEFASRMHDNVDAYETAALRIYEAVMGVPASEPPEIMCVGEEG